MSKVLILKPQKKTAETCITGKTKNTSLEITGRMTKHKQKVGKNVKLIKNLEFVKKANQLL